MYDLSLKMSGALGLRARSGGSSEVFRSWPLVEGRAFKAVLRIRLRSSLVYIGTWGAWVGAELDTRFEGPTGLLEASGGVESSLSPPSEPAREEPNAATEARFL